MGEMQNLSRQINFNNLIYYRSKTSSPMNFIGFRGPLNLHNTIHDDNTTIKEAEKNQ